MYSFKLTEFCAQLALEACNNAFFKKYSTFPTWLLHFVVSLPEFKTNWDFCINSRHNIHKNNKMKSRFLDISANCVGNKTQKGAFNILQKHQLSAITALSLHFVFSNVCVLPFLFCNPSRLLCKIDQDSWRASANSCLLTISQIYGVTLGFWLSYWRTLHIITSLCWGHSCLCQSVLLWWCMMWFLKAHTVFFSLSLSLFSSFLHCTSLGGQVQLEVLSVKISSTV